MTLFGSEILDERASTCGAGRPLPALPPRISDTTQDTPDCRFPDRGCDRNLYFGIAPCPENGASRQLGHPQFGMYRDDAGAWRVCDPHAMLRGGVLSQTAQTMALPLLLLVMTQRGVADERQMRLCLLFALLMSTSSLKLSAFSVVALVGIVALGVQLAIEMVPRLLGKPSHLGFANWHSVRRASGATSLFLLATFLLMRWAGVPTLRRLDAQLETLDVALAYLPLALSALLFLLFLYAGYVEERRYAHGPPGGFGIRSSCREDRARVQRLRDAVAPWPPHRLEKEPAMGQRAALPNQPLW